MVLALAMIFGPGVLAQEPVIHLTVQSTPTVAPSGSGSATVPAFEVISVKVNKAGTGGFRSMYTPIGFHMENVPIIMLIRQAYSLYNSNDDQITGLPKWAETERFDIDAKVSEEDQPKLKALSREQRGEMMKALLAERFEMKAHAESREMPIYALVIAKGGLKIKEATPGAEYPNAPKGPDGKPAGAGMMMMGRGMIRGQALPLSQLASMLTQDVERTVLDRTGLTGKYDFVLEWTPEESASSGPGGPPTVAFIDSKPSLFTALQEQLGLKLESTRGPVPGVVVDHIAEPAAN
jgi:uncharacterized protein (TIGR03435 family)